MGKVSRFFYGRRQNTLAYFGPDPLVLHRPVRGLVREGILGLTSTLIRAPSSRRSRLMSHAFLIDSTIKRWEYCIFPWRIPVPSRYDDIAISSRNSVQLQPPQPPTKSVAGIRHKQTTCRQRKQMEYKISLVDVSISRPLESRLANSIYILETEP